MTTTAGVILAAGSSTRYGGTKLLALIDGKPIVQHVIDAANASALDRVIVVLGDRADAILRAVRLGRAVSVVNRHWANGQSTSLRSGIRAADDAGAVVVLLGDQPLVTPELIAALVGAHSPGVAAVVSMWRGRRSPPVLLGRELFASVDALTGDVGARDLLAARSDVAEIHVTAALGSLEDVDRPEDLHALEDAAASLERHRAGDVPDVDGRPDPQRQREV